MDRAADHHRTRRGSACGAYTLSDNMRLSDLLLLAGGPSPDAYLDRAVLLHQHGDGTYGIDYVNLLAFEQRPEPGCFRSRMAMCWRSIARARPSSSQSMWPLFMAK